jgi:hypothetical protein
MFEAEELVQDHRTGYNKPLIEADAYYVTISHKELDGLVGSLMHLMDLNSDAQFREAMKSEIKSRARRWLDDEYERAGYRNYAVQHGARIYNLNRFEDADLVKTWETASQR